MHFTVEEENLICMYHNADRRRTMGKITAALPDMDGDMRALAQQTLSKVVSRVMRKIVYGSGRNLLQGAA